jgi:class 3 adenylate cyclase/ligand-binding sensor domain-containing protein
MFATNNFDLVRKPFLHNTSLFSRILFLLLSLNTSFLIQNTSAQEGSSFITNFNLSETVYSNQNWSIVQDKDEVMLFANRRGVLTYDGAYWKEISLPDIIFTMAPDPQKSRIYAGCRNGFGYLSKDEKGIYNYTELSATLKNTSEISKLELTSDAVYFYNNESISRCLLSNLSNTRQWSTTSTNPFAGTIKFKDKIYVVVSGKGLHVIENDSLQALKTIASVPDEILFSANFDENRVMVGTGNDELFLFDGKSFTKFLFEGQKHIAENILANGVELNENEIAISTVTGGCLIIDKKTGATSQSINYRTGLPDDELYAIGKDRSNGLWLSHEYGLSRIDNNLPVRNYSSYPGLEGNLNSVATSGTTLYVATSQGVYFLTKTFDNQEVQKLIQLQDKEKIERIKMDDKKTSSQTDFQSLFDTPISSETASEKSVKEEKKEQREEKKKKNKEKWNNLFGSKKKDKKTGKNEEIETVEEEVPQPEEETKTEPVVQPEKKLPEKKQYPVVKQSEVALPLTKFGTTIFKKVNGLTEKCKQMVVFKEQLLVATNMGLYVIKNDVAKILIPNRYINCISASANDNRFYIGTNNGVLSVKWNGSDWVVENGFENFNNPVYSITEERGKNLWLGSDGVVFNTVVDENAKAAATKSYSFDKDYAEKVITGRVDGKVNFFLASGIYGYDAAKDSLVNTDKNADGTAKVFNRRYVSSQEDITWSYNNAEKKWKSFKNNPSQNLIFSAYLDLFDGIQNIFVDAQGNFWVIDGENSLYKILPSEKFIGMHDFNVYIRGVSDNQENDFALEQLVVDADNNMLSFKIAAPYYLKTDATEYQYIIDGLMTDWSKWDSKSEIGPFPLPPGSYTLRVRARNILGTISAEKTLSFSINPPFYKTWYFYLLYALVGVGMVWLFIRFREASLKREQVILEEKVRLRTAQLAEQKEKTEELLLNILPHETAEELKLKGFATTRFYNMASVMFTDFKDFTKISETMKPTELIEELDSCFRQFDDIIEKYNLEKIKTIGDSYMCAGGIPKADDFNPIRITLAALEICEFMEARRKEKKVTAPFEIRIGIHTGPITAGVVGKKKFAYDIWSDTVNTASRMESSGKVGKVNVSGTTYEFIKTYFDCEHRGKVEAKNKGQIDMYFVTGIKERYSENGKIPNELFLELLASEESLQKV